MARHEASWPLSSVSGPAIVSAPGPGASNGPRTFCPRPSPRSLQASNRQGFFHLKIFNNPLACKLMSMDLGAVPHPGPDTKNIFNREPSPVSAGWKPGFISRHCLQLHLTPNRFQAWDVFYQAMTKSYAALRLSEFKESTEQQKPAQCLLPMILILHKAWSAKMRR